jgi:hypothetical protein
MGSKRCASELGYMDGRIGGWMSELNYRPRIFRARLNNGISILQAKM